MSGQETAPARRLKQFQPLNRLTDDQLVLLASRAEHRKLAPGQKVMERGARDGLDFFLLAGSVELESIDGRRSRIQAGSDQAVNAVARLQPRMYDVLATQPCEFLVVEQDVLNQMLRTAPVNQVDMDSSTDEGGEPDEEHQLMMEFYADLRSNQLTLPSVPDVAWKVRRMADREDSTADQIASAITADPSMAAKLVRACNSPLYRGFNDVRNVREAVVRLGTNTTRQLVTVFALREVFQSRQPLLQKTMEDLWKRSREVAALSWVLADSVTRINPEEALLAGLLHDIGVVPVVVHAERHVNLFADEVNLKRAITELRGDVGAAVLENWNFPASFVETARYADDWEYECREAAPQLVDVVIVARLHALIGANQSANLPRFEQVPAYRRLGELELNVSRSLKLLTEARARIDEVQQLLSIH
ncbi:HDOD domain-containing protein [Marinobacter xestospongiae]|uniref:HDOD domain-containing protein n=1 Tax=Marinobacter xestospongiae TaxID=994319 RepID=UPI002005F06D|nr:HDOD domain-containing protein [Marinobacter xestospongiae]MCK7567587.1 HDOD domain-containing protein [Marinobacter xestospongiae]